MSGLERCRLHGIARWIVGLAIEHMAGRIVGDPDQRIVGVGLVVIAIRSARRNAGEPITSHRTTLAVGHSLWGLGDLRSPCGVVGSGWIVELDRPAVIREQNLSGGKR